MEENIEEEPVAKKQKIENSKDAVIIDDEARLSELLYRTLKDVFGFDSFRKGQYAVIRSLMRGNNTVAIFPTGSGKSLCYQLPACLLGLFGVTVVVSPLLALMKDQMDAMRAKGIAADMIGSSLSFEERRATRERLQNGQTNVLLVAPEQLNNESSKALILSLKISLLVIDEVHCISEWGHSFRPDYLRLASFAQACGCSRVLGLTATATPAVVQDVCRAFQVSPESCIQTPFHRKNLRLCFHAVSSGSRHDKLLDLLQVPLSDAGPSIVYVTRQETAVTVSAALTASGHAAKPYHAGLSTELLEEAQQWFMSCDDSIIVATIAFGMGIDKANVRRVIHYNLPKSLEGYAQEVGRAGRDGLPSHCDLLYCPDDLSDLEGFARCGTPTVRAIRSALDEVFLNSEDGNRPFPAGTVRELSLYQLSQKYDLSDNTLKMLLAFVGIYHGHLDEVTPKYNTYQMKWVDDSKSCKDIPKMLLERVKGPTGKVLSELCVPKKSWTHLNMDEVVSQLSPLLHLSPSVTRNKVLNDINSFETELIISASNVINCFRILSVPADIEALAASESERFLRREQQDMKRLEQVLQLISSKTCHSRVLMDHFGDGKSMNVEQQTEQQPEQQSEQQLSAEGKNHFCSCQWCCESTPKSVIDTAGVLSSINSRPIDEALADQLRLAVSSGAIPNDDCLLLTRVCLGFSSPRITKLKLKSHPMYHSMAGCGYDEVYALCKQICENSQQ